MHCNQDSYNKIWDKIIKPQITFLNSSVEWISVDMENAKNAVWEEYKTFNSYCKETYMDKEVKRLDRHKVAACYIFAIISASPLKIDKQEMKRAKEQHKIILANEQLAIVTGLSILRCFLYSKLDRENNLKMKECLHKDRKIFKNGFQFPYGNEVSHGDYRTNFAIELYFTKKEKMYNILSLSHSLYLLEMYNRNHWEIQKTES